MHLEQCCDTSWCIFCFFVRLDRAKTKKRPECHNTFPYICKAHKNIFLTYHFLYAPLSKASCFESDGTLTFNAILVT